MNKNMSFQSLSNIFQTMFDNGKFLQILNSLSQIILLILFLSWILKKISFFKVNNILSKMKVLDRLSVGPHEYIVLVEVKTVQLVLGVTTKNITYLCTLSPISKDKPVMHEDNTFLKKST